MMLSMKINKASRGFEIHNHFNLQSYHMSQCTYQWTVRPKAFQNVDLGKKHHDQHFLLSHHLNHPSKNKFQFLSDISRILSSGDTVNRDKILCISKFKHDLRPKLQIGCQLKVSKG